MNATATSPALPSSSGKRWRIPLMILSFLIILVIAAGAVFWWMNRPIKATVLQAPEKVVLDQKLAALDAGANGNAATPNVEVPATVEPTYEIGAKTIVLTEREINGLLHENTGLGDQLKLELAANAIHARISADIPEDFPIMSGKKLKGKARFFIKDASGNPALILDDITLWGISLPNAWLGELKGENLLSKMLGKSPSGGIAGVKELKIENGRLIIELDD